MPALQARVSVQLRDCALFEQAVQLEQFQFGVQTDMLESVINSLTAEFVKPFIVKRLLFNEQDTPEVVPGQSIIISSEPVHPELKSDMDDSS